MVMEHVHQFHDALRRQDGQAVEIKRLLDDCGVVLLEYEKPYPRRLSNETQALSTIQRLYRNYGGIVMRTTLNALVACRKADALNADSIRAVTELVRIFPNWVVDPDAFVSALSEINLEKVRAKAANFGDRQWISIMVLLTERLTLTLGPGGWR